jgi:hypothetical protein
LGYSCCLGYVSTLHATNLGQVLERGSLKLTWVGFTGVLQDDRRVRVQYPGYWALPGAWIAGCGRQGWRERTGAQRSACIETLSRLDEFGFIGQAQRMSKRYVHTMERHDTTPERAWQYALLGEDTCRILRDGRTQKPKPSPDCSAATFAARQNGLLR